MTDPRIQKLARILVNYSITVKKGSVIKINYGIDAKELALECYKLIIKKGAIPSPKAIVPGFGYFYYKLASDNLLKKVPLVSKFEAEKTDGWISIGAEYNSKEFTHIDPKKIALRSKITKPISDIVMKRDNWVMCEFPTHAMAQDAEMSLSELEDFVYSATNIDWKKESIKQDKIKKILDKGSHVRIKSQNTDIRFSIKGRLGIKSDGKRNMPSGEVFIAPDENSTQGHIKYDFPAIYSGKEVTGVKLEFTKGKVTKATAEKGEDFLKEMIATDKGSCKLGEFGIGLNFGIKKHIKNILFDEKIGGTIHLALGMAYKKGGGRNESAVHWDMIKDLRHGGDIYVDDKLIQKNGKFLFKL